MSSPLSLHLAITGSQPRQISTISYTLSPDQREVILGPSKDQPATFLIGNLPPFLQEKRGLYLGRLYTPQLYLNGRPYYLQATSRENHYQLVDSANSDRLFGFSVLRPGLKWGERADMKSIHFENFNPGSAPQYLLSTRPRSSTQAIYSPADCEGPDDYCGPTNPDLTIQEGGFGLRGPDVIYTYKVSRNGKTVTVAASSKSLITADLETNDTVRERYFFADGDEYRVGVDYPIYIWVDQEKRYLSNPRRLTEDGPTIYELTAQPRENTARLSPMAPSNWREMTVTPNDFINLAFNNTPELALWRDESYQGRPAVVASQRAGAGSIDPTPADERSPAAPSQNPAPAFLAAFPQTTVPTRVAAPPPVPPPTPPPTAFWQHWWFWLLIGLALLLLIILLVIIITRSRSPSTTAVVYGGEPTAYLVRK